MRKNARLDLLENECARLARLIEQLFEVVTAPEPKQETPTETSDWRSRPRKRVNTPNHNREWTQDEISFMQTAYAKGISAKEIGRALGRSEKAIWSAFNRYKAN